MAQFELASLKQNDLPAMMQASAKEFSNRVLIDFMGRQWLFHQVMDEVERLTSCIQQAGVKPGDRVGLCLPNSPYSVICYYAVLKAGATIVNLSPLYSASELQYLLHDSAAKLVFVIDVKEVADKIVSITPKCPEIKTVVYCALAEALPTVKSCLYRLVKGKLIAKLPDSGKIAQANALGYKAFLAGCRGPSQPVKIDSHQVAVLQFTGGTTGVPKGAMLTHHNLISNLRQMNDKMNSLEAGGERFLCVLPFFHIFAMTTLMNMAVAAGAMMILLPRFDLKMTLKALAKYKPTIFPAVPTIYTALVNAQGVDYSIFKSLKYCLSGGAPLPVTLRKEFSAKTGVRLVEGYGLSESSPVITVNELEGEYVDGSVGRAVKDTVVTIRDPEDPTKILPVGERGEICASGPQIMLGYFNRPEESAKALADGCLHTGDVGVMDEKGYVYILDRLKDLILVGGFNVYPHHIEAVLYRHPAVEEVIVLGMPDSYLGEVPHAYIKLREGHSPSTEEIMNYLKPELGKHELPRAIVFRASLPKTMIGKLSKKDLRIVLEEEAKKS